MLPQKPPPHRYQASGTLSFFGTSPRFRPPDLFDMTVSTRSKKRKRVEPTPRNAFPNVLDKVSWLVVMWFAKVRTNVSFYEGSRR